MLVIGARATIQGLQSRADLNGVVVSLLSWIPASGRWRARTDAGEVIALKSECLSVDVSKPPICQALLWGPLFPRRCRTPPARAMPEEPPWEPPVVDLGPLLPP